MPKKQQKIASNKKNIRKPTHFKIQFYIKIYVTSFDFGHFCSDGPIQRALMQSLFGQHWQGTFQKGTYFNRDRRKYSYDIISDQETLVCLKTVWSTTHCFWQSDGRHKNHVQYCYSL